jgi:SAM-dependent methyltransferase
MDPKAAYPVEKIYGAFLHRELSVSWLVLATLLGGRHRLDPDLLNREFSYLDLGCGHGLNLIFNAVAHPRARFFGLDLNPTHIAQATARAEALGLTNVHFALADLTTFAGGRPGAGPCRDWPEAFDFVVSHGLASWVSPEVRQSLVAAASAVLRPGGIFFCSYNTYPGWLARSPLQMLSVEEALRAGGSTTVSGIRRAVATLTQLTGPEGCWPLGNELPALRTLEEQLRAMPEDYLAGEYQAAHQPLYVGPMHRLCSGFGLSHIGSASLPEMFPSLLDPGRRALVEEAGDEPMREVLLDLAIHQTFRRDLFAKGIRRPAAPWRRQALANVTLHFSAVPDNRESFASSFGQLGMEPTFLTALKDLLAERPRSLGELMDVFPIELEDLVLRLTVLLWSGGVVGAFPAGAEAEQEVRSIAAINQRCLDLMTAGEDIEAVLSPVLRQPFPIHRLEAFFLQAAGADLPAEDLVPLVWMGITMAGGKVNDAEGQPIKDPEQAQVQLQEFWDSFASGRLPVLRRLGLGS